MFQLKGWKTTVASDNHRACCEAAENRLMRRCDLTVIVSERNKMTMDSYMIIKVDHAGKDVNIMCDLCVCMYTVCVQCAT